MYKIVVLVKRQIRLRNSITLIDLKFNKVHYILFSSVVFILSVYTVFQLFDGRSPDTIFFAEHFAFEKWQTNIALGGILLVQVLFFALLLTIALSKSAIVDKGVYTGIGYIEWHFLYDYLIDMHNHAVVLTASKSTFLTVLNTTPLLRVDKNNIQKLIFILNKNKNKFNQMIE
ncbi:MAG: hypothetical protein FWD76_00115 [Firmicutes bacterium]|nr:hypothetical protein [Bacillota bacterium]